MMPGLRGTCVVACLPSWLWLCHASEPWEWAGVFNFPQPAHYIWSAARNAQGQYADPTMKLVFASASAASSAGLHAVEQRAETLWNGATTDVQAGGELEAADGAYRLVFDQRTWVSHFEIHVDTPGAYAVFAEHSPLEFENGFHFLRTEAGADVEAAAEEAADGHGHGHGHDDHEDHAEEHCPWAEPWEWAGVFELGTTGHYTWNAARGQGGSYADEQMRLVVLQAANSSEEGLEDAAENAKVLWESGTTIQKSTGDVLQLGGSYDLMFDDHAWASHFLLQVNAPGAVAVFAQHLPTEFERDFHYFKTAAGEDVEPTKEISVTACSQAGGEGSEAADQSHTGLWGEVLAGAFLTCLPTLLGVFFAIPDMAGKAKRAMEKASPIINAFASGVIFSAAVFLLLPEALHLAGSGHDEEVVGTWTWGTSLMAGWFSCYLIRCLCQLFEGDAPESTGFEAEGNQDAKLTKANVLALTGPVLLGDVFHNFADGLVLGVGFKVCGKGFGWQLVGVTIAHELPQEIADFVILIINARMKWYWATLANFLSSVSTILGAIITYSTNVGSNEEGYILAYGAGFYLFVAITELGNTSRPKGLTRPQLLMHFAARWLAFTVGAVLLGLVLIGHEHCYGPPPAEGEVAEGGHQGHGHHH